MPASKRAQKQHNYKNSPKARPACPKGEQCQLVRTGNCPKFHPLCFHGVTCRFLRARNCGYAHPPKHYELMDKSSKHNDKNNKNNVTKNTINKNNISVAYTVDDDSLINAIHPFKKPNRHQKKWEKWEDEKLVKFMNQSNNIKDPKAIKQLANEFQRSENGVAVRLNKIKNTKKTKLATKTTKANIEKDNGNDSDSSSDSSSSEVSDSNSGSPFLVNNKNKSNKSATETPKIIAKTSKKSASLGTSTGAVINHIDKKLMEILMDLKVYYSKMENGFEVRGIENLMERIKQSKWNNIKELEGIIGCDIKYFKDKLDGMKERYGIIDREMKSKTINVLASVKCLCENEIKSINNIMNNINENNWLGDINEFERTTNYNLCYFLKIKTVMNGPKILEGNKDDLNEKVLDKILDQSKGKYNENESEVDDEFIKKRRIRGLSVDSNIGCRGGNNNSYRQHRNYNWHNKNNRNRYNYKGGYYNKQYNNDRKRNRSYRNDQFSPNAKRTRYNKT